ncbi:MAG: DNA-3-methyladenine glycosylase [Candidatus Pacearchaeota archaeon]|nr:MAG: DNA-3-methyladenine glycosylase [Candidatus Pacearchaeota archaeon]
MKQKLLSKSFFNKDTVKTAKALLGKIIKYKNTSGIIIETEAYKGKEDGDEASHAFKKTERSELMYNSYGKFYIYFIYGNYYCLNITAEKNKPGAVLIRAIKPIKGIKNMEKRRQRKDNLTDGPGKLCQALNITKALNGTDINDKIKILKGIKIKNSQIGCSSRIGINKAQHLKWRFFVKEKDAS